MAFVGSFTMAFIGSLATDEANSAQGKNDQGSEAQVTALVVRNTFIDVYTQPRRNRCNSMPASYGNTEGFGEVGFAALPSKDLLPSSMDASTDASGEYPSAECKEVDEGGFLEEEESLPMATAPPSPRPWSPAGSEPSPATPARPPPVPSVLPVLAVMPPVSHPEEALGGSPARSPLSSKAKAWSPTSTTATAGRRLRTFQAESQIVMEEIKAAVRGFQGCVGAEICWDGLPGRTATCTLTALLPAQQWGLRERFVEAAKEVVMAATTASASSVFLLGCKQMPFMAEAQGFCAALGEMRDETRACWSMYSMGFCKRKGACRWKHPQASVSFHFAVAMAAAPPPCPGPCAMFAPAQSMQRLQYPLQSMPQFQPQLQQPEQRRLQRGQFMQTMR